MMPNQRPNSSAPSTTATTHKEETENQQHTNGTKQQQQQQQQEERIKTQNTTTTKSSSSSSWYNQDYDVLLVDPPRSGLDEKVCNMALNGTFTHIIYISCGRHALLKDLQRLCCCKEEEEDEKSSCFEVVDCALLDLFPRTKESVESLVHLRRRRRPIVS
mmetsp:Transcript_557/g.860  ORF Transcript_557/g.860 Transcript_557/m.860 type:complete len:160 (-) Transcript_557:102-581(-)